MRDPQSTRRLGASPARDFDSKPARGCDRQRGLLVKHPLRYARRTQLLSISSGANGRCVYSGYDIGRHLKGALSRRVRSAMQPNRVPSRDTQNEWAVADIAVVVLTAMSWCFCVYCVGRGRDLLAAYWALISYFGPKTTQWFQETE